MADVLQTERLTLRPWRMDDAEPAFGIFGNRDVARWLSPALERVADVEAMTLLLQQWILEDDRALAPAGRWAVERTADHQVVGGVALLYLPPGGVDLELAVQLAPDVWGQGLATEAGRRVARYALAEHHAGELAAVTRPANTRAATMATRIGMEWVGETEKYYDLRLEVYRLRAADLDKPLPGQVGQISGRPSAR